MMSLEGVPAFYIHSLFGTENDYALYQKTGHNRSLNRGKIDYNKINTESTNTKESKIYNKLRELLLLRRNQAAFHPKYRAYGKSAKTPKHLLDAEVYAVEFLNLCWNTAKDKGFDQINIISIGIGGSYEGSKLLLESLNNPIGFSVHGREKINYKFVTGSDLSEFEEKTKFLNH